MDPAFRNRRVLLICVIVLASVTLVSGFVSSAARSSARHVEGFQTTTMLPPDWKPDKTPLMIREGLHFAFTDGSLSGSTELVQKVMFSPSMKDIFCKFSKRVPPNVRCTDMLVEEFSEPDTMELPSDIVGTNAVADSPPLQSKDTVVRILGSTYTLYKRCIILRKASIAGSGTQQVLSLPSDLATTAVFVLLRPIFVSMPGSILYKVSYDPADYKSATNSLILFDNKVADAVMVVLYPVNGRMDTKSYVTSNGRGNLVDSASTMQLAANESSTTYAATMRSLVKGTAQPDYISVNLFYLTEAERISNMPLAEAFSLFVGDLKDPQTVFQTDELTVSYNRDGNLTATRGTTNAIVAVPPGSKIVLTYSVNLLTMCIMHKESGRIVYRRFPGFPALNIGNADALVANISSAGLSMPSPSFNLCIPNLLRVVLGQNVALGASGVKLVI